MAVAVLNRNRAQRIEAGHPWVFNNEVEAVRGHFAPGDIVDVVDHRGHFIGRGYINPRSQILVRLLTRAEEPVDAAFFRRRIDAAWAYRRRVLGDDAQSLGSCRAVFAEADLVPALIVDKYNDILVLQALALGVDMRLDQIVAALVEVLQPRAVYARNDAPVRRLEGLECDRGWLLGAGAAPDVAEITEHGLTFVVDYQAGQKTGFFLDQRENRAAIAPYCAGARVLDAFAYTGAFALHAAAYGAAEVVAVESSAEAAATGATNAARNGIAVVRWETANAFDYLRQLDRDRERFDLVVLDPPAFVKSRSAIEGALRGYKEINLRALKVLRAGGTLVTCSCSYHLYEDEFRAVVLDAARDARRTVRVIEARGQSRDHPVLLSTPETRYLKCLICEVL
jgi:23S rRNA (cytosine1962-C5)-methyltransferase